MSVSRVLVCFLFDDLRSAGLLRDPIATHFVPPRWRREDGYTPREGRSACTGGTEWNATIGDRMPKPIQYIIRAVD